MEKSYKANSVVNSVSNEVSKDQLLNEKADLDLRLAEINVDLAGMENFDKVEEAPVEEPVEDAE